MPASKHTHFTYNTLSFILISNKTFISSKFQTRHRSASHPLPIFSSNNTNKRQNYKKQNVSKPLSSSSSSSPSACPCAVFPLLFFWPLSRLCLFHVYLRSCSALLTSQLVISIYLFIYASLLVVAFVLGIDGWMDGWIDHFTQRPYP